MKKKNVIILSIFLSVFFTMIGVGAATMFNARDIEFIPNDSSWEVDNLSDAIDDLYNKTNEKKGLQLIGSYSGNTTIDVSSYLKESDTVNNFIVEVTKIPESGNPQSGTGFSTHWPKLVQVSPSKSLSGNILTIEGMNINFGVLSDGDGYFRLSSYAYMQYNVYYIG